LSRSIHRPRIIVTEDFADTDSAKYTLLSGLGYRFVGAWGADSIWISRSHPADASPLRLPLWRMPADWTPSGLPATGQVCFESLTRQCVVGWAFRDAGCPPAPDVVIELRRVNSPQRSAFRAARLPRE